MSEGMSGEQWMMSAKRRKMIIRDAMRDFCPGISPEPMMNGKPLGGYDLSCYMEGWNKAQSEQEDMDDE